jgi:hypothetical protein
MKELHQPLKAVHDKLSIVDGWCYNFFDCFAFVWFVVLQVMCDNLWQCLTLMFCLLYLIVIMLMNVVLDSTFAIYGMFKQFVGTLVFKYDKKLNLQFMKEPLTTLM